MVCGSLIRLVIDLRMVLQQSNMLFTENGDIGFRCSKWLHTREKNQEIIGPALLPIPKTDITCTDEESYTAFIAKIDYVHACLQEIQTRAIEECTPPSKMEEIIVPSLLPTVPTVTDEDSSMLLTV